jgi:undecaprenyl-diphosphatase
MVAFGISLFTIMAVFRASDLGGGFDAALETAVYSIRTGVLTQLMTVITTIGDWYGLVPIGLFFALAPWTRRDGGWIIATTLAVSSILNELLKLAFQVQRPASNQLVDVTGYSFPSGHAQDNAAIWSVIAVAVVASSLPRIWRTSAVIIGTTLVFTVGFSRIYLGVHSPIDVIAGIGIGAAVAGGVLLAAAHVPRLTPRWLMSGC